MIKDLKITKAIINERKELQVSFIVKQGDYTEQELELLRQAKINGDTLDIEFTGLVKGVEDDVIKKNRTRLEMSLKSYCEHFSLNYESELNKIYKNHLIHSRTQLTNTQLEDLIESYNLAIRTDIM